MNQKTPSDMKNISNGLSKLNSRQLHHLVFMLLCISFILVVLIHLSQLQASSRLIVFVMYLMLAGSIVMLIITLCIKKVSLKNPLIQTFLQTKSKDKYMYIRSPQTTKSKKLHYRLHQDDDRGWVCNPPPKRQQKPASDIGDRRGLSYHPQSPDKREPESIYKKSGSRWESLPKEVNCPLGLPNIGNSCFLNSIIQLLYGATKFRNMLIHHYVEGPKCKDSKTCAEFMAIIFHQMKLGKSANKAKINHHLNYLLSMLEKINNSYQLYRQQDATETLLSILRQVEKYHPQVRTLFDISYEAKCRCRNSTIRSTERIVSFNPSYCPYCHSLYRRTLMGHQPSYMIQSGNSKTQSRLQHLLNEYKYTGVSQVIYVGSGYSGHYYAMRKHQGKVYELNDESVREIQRDYKGSHNILLYLFQKDQNQHQNLSFPSQVGQPLNHEQQCLLIKNKSNRLKYETKIEKNRQGYKQQQQQKEPKSAVSSQKTYGLLKKAQTSKQMQREQRRLAPANKIEQTIMKREASNTESESKAKSHESIPWPFKDIRRGLAYSGQVQVINRYHPVTKKQWYQSRKIHFIVQVEVESQKCFSSNILYCIYVENYINFYAYKPDKTNQFDNMVKQCLKNNKVLRLDNVVKWLEQYLQFLYRQHPDFKDDRSRASFFQADYRSSKTPFTGNSIDFRS